MYALRRTTWLQRTILADAALSAVFGVLMTGGAGLLAQLLALPVDLLRYVGVFLLLHTAFLTYVGTRPTVMRPAVWVVIGINALWTIDSIILLFTGWVAPNLLGYAFVIAQAVVVGILAEIQYLALRGLGGEQ